jgi:2-polyprenyl-3-methyl-5-hydroxy-6-metoxy-1,4-benzoquinol methylase
VPDAQPTFDIVCDDSTELQSFLNDLYQYKHDITTKVYHRSRIALFCRMCRQLISDGVVRNFDSALDIGCNAGFYAKVISDFGFQNVYGVDINADYIAKANRAFYSDRPGKSIRFQAMDAAAIPRNNAYSFILCTEVIEHTGDPDAVVDTIMALLSPGGVAVVSLPNRLSLGYSTAYVAALAKRREVQPELRDHLKYPAYRGPQLFKHKGAKIVRTAGVNFLFNDPLVRLFHGAPFFDTVNRLNFWTSHHWPMKWFAQFFFFAIVKNAPPPT